MSKYSNEGKIVDEILRCYSGKKKIIADRYDEEWKISRGDYKPSNRTLMRLVKKFNCVGEECDIILDFTKSPEYNGPVLRELRYTLGSYCGVISSKSSELARKIDDAFATSKIISPSEAYIERFTDATDVATMIEKRNWRDVSSLVMSGPKATGALFLTDETVNKYDAKLCKNTRLVYSTILYQLLSYSTHHTDMSEEDIKAISSLVRRLKSTDILSVSLDTREFKTGFKSYRSDRTTSENGYVPDYVKKLGELTNHKK